MTLLIGILCGLGCALAHSFCYIFTRRFMLPQGRTSLQLLGVGHIYMGVFSLAALPFLWRTPESGWQPTLLYTLFATLSYLAAQVSLFTVVRWAPASRISPFLGIKIVFIAALASVFVGSEINLRQWGAVGLCLLSALLLVGGGSERLPWKVIIGTTITALCYAVSDLCIARQIFSVSSGPSVAASSFAVCLNYLFCAMLSLVGMLHPRLRPPADDKTAWREGIYFSLSWYGAMVLLFITISFLTIVPAVILQSTRGPMSVALGLLLAALGHHALEKKILLADAVKYLFAALLMCVSLYLYFS